MAGETWVLATSMQTYLRKGDQSIAVTNCLHGAKLTLARDSADFAKTVSKM
jgi:hypothetical protein